MSPAFSPWSLLSERATPQEDPESFLGPMVIGMFLQGVELGIVLNQSFTFWSRVDNESYAIRVLVAFVTLVAIFQTVIALYKFWNSYVLDYGNYTTALMFTWVDKLGPIVTILMAAPVQSFLIARCWHLSHRNWIAVVLLSSVLAVSIVSHLIVTANMFSIDFSKIAKMATPPEPVKIPPDVAYILSLAGSAVLDIALTMTLLAYLWKMSVHVYSSRFRRVTRKLVVLIWEAAVPPCVCAILALSTYLTMVNRSFWNLMFQAILGKLYVISLFVTLNGRQVLATVVTSTANDRLTSIAWVTNAPQQPVRINVDVESHYQVTSNGPSHRRSGDGAGRGRGGAGGGNSVQMHSMNSTSEGESVSAKSDTKQSPLAVSLADDGLAFPELKK